MTVTVQLFARAKDLLGASSINVEVAEGSTVGDLRRLLSGAHPALGPLLRRSAIAVDENFARDDERLYPNRRVALLPPVSGGS